MTSLIGHVSGEFVRSVVIVRLHVRDISFCQGGLFIMAYTARDGCYRILGKFNPLHPKCQDQASAGGVTKQNLFRKVMFLLKHRQT